LPGDRIQLVAVAAAAVIVGAAAASGGCGGGGGSAAAVGAAAIAAAAAAAGGCGVGVRALADANEVMVARPAALFLRAPLPSLPHFPPSW